MLRMLFVASAVLVCGCSDSKPAKKTKEKPTDVALTAGPVSVTLAKIDAKRLRPITSIKEFVIIDPKGALSVGAPKAGATPWVGEPADRWHDRTGFLEYDLDSFGTLSRDASATALILADATTPARLMLTSGIQAYGYKPVALAAGAANTAVLYQFGGEPWPDFDKRADLTLRTDQLDRLAGQKPHTVLLQFTDATTTAELLEALTAVAETGAEQVRLHRMMGWGQIGPSDIVWVRDPVADDDIITEGEKATVTIVDANARIDGKVKAEAIGTAMSSASPRFRYCYEKSGVKKSGKLELSFDVAQDGSIANAAAKGINAAIESCIAGAIFDSHVPTDGIDGPAHAIVPIAFGHGEEAVVATTPDKPEKPEHGWWCWIHQDNSVGMCARQQDQCDATLIGFNQTAESLHDTASTNECRAQKTAWETGSSRPLPTKAMCKAALEKGEKCRELK